jgi:hypothetical protein
LYDLSSKYYEDMNRVYFAVPLVLLGYASTAASFLVTVAVPNRLRLHRPDHH